MTDAARSLGCSEGGGKAAAEGKDPKEGPSGEIIKRRNRAVGRSKGGRRGLCLVRMRRKVSVHYKQDDV